VRKAEAEDEAEIASCERTITTELRIHRPPRPYVTFEFGFVISRQPLLVQLF